MFCKYITSTCNWHQRVLYMPSCAKVALGRRNVRKNAMPDGEPPSKLMQTPINTSLCTRKANNKQKHQNKVSAKLTLPRNRGHTKRESGWPAAFSMRSCKFLDSRRSSQYSVASNTGASEPLGMKAGLIPGSVSKGGGTAANGLHKSADGSPLLASCVQAGAWSNQSPKVANRYHIRPGSVRSSRGPAEDREN